MDTDSSDIKMRPTMAIMLDTKKIRAIFLFEFKMGRKAAETAHNINNAFGPGTAKECTVQWWFKKHCKGDKSLEDEECSSRSLEVDNDQWRAIIEADPLTATQEVIKEFNIDHSMVVQHLKQIGKVKKLVQLTLRSHIIFGKLKMEDFRSCQEIT
ncbi:hypothetical protein AV530_005908 [Patagioenas fasciata monilis]|uniref:Mos1 transposase HTH domain-containing protein n=1 Tax=Patagioenas fasciata monilis TaxID=372326 RepID=A0A1V4JN23_PATFA|nr:hypothetical protein AV530_005908 [Patagioenas fasciata monilis]